MKQQERNVRKVEEGKKFTTENTEDTEKEREKINTETQRLRDTKNKKQE